MADVKVQIAVEALLTKSLKEMVQQIYDEYSVRVTSVSVDWSLFVMKAEVTCVRLETAYP